jgi:hypothetical protein
MFLAEKIMKKLLKKVHEQNVLETKSKGGKDEDVEKLRVMTIIVVGC